MTEREFSQKTIEMLREIRKRQPLVHHITNFVVMNSTANVTLAIGASPIMAHAHEEMEAMSAFTSVLNLNIGTLTPYWIDSMVMAGKIAGKRGIPIILDPVGSGATPLRTDAVKRIIAEVPVTVIRGNASEVMSLFTKEDEIKIRGVDSLETVDAVRHGAHQLAGALEEGNCRHRPVDFVTDGDRAVEIHNGDPMFGHW